eukprot:12220479-Alexandrium_andersonii.AAC.1
MLARCWRARAHQALAQHAATVNRPNCLTPLHLCSAWGVPPVVCGRAAGPWVHRWGVPAQCRPFRI